MNDKLNQVLSKQKQQIDEPEIKNNEDISPTCRLRCW